MDEHEASLHLQQIVLRGLRAGRPVEIEGLGTFYPDSELGVRFEAFAVGAGRRYGWPSRQRRCEARMLQKTKRDSISCRA